MHSRETLLPVTCYLLPVTCYLLPLTSLLFAHPQNNLPEVPVLLHHPVRRLHFLEGEHLLDERDDGSVGKLRQSAPREFGHDLPFFRDRPGTEHGTDDTLAL